MKIFFVIFLFIQNTMAGIISHNTINARLHDYTYQEFCDSMKAKSSLLASSVNLNEMECFNQKFKISEFCLKKLPLEASFTRGFAVPVEKKVYCEEASSVRVSLTCDSVKELCKKPSTSCEKLKKVYAVKLELSHASHVEKNINCYYTKNTEESLDEI